MAEPLLERSDAVQLVSRGDALSVFGPAGVHLTTRGDSAVLAAAIVRALEHPLSLPALVLQLAREFEDVTETSPALGQALQALRTAGVLTGGPRVQGAALPPVTGSRVVLLVSGAVAAALVPSLVVALQQRGALVRVALSRSARRFVEPRALEALTHHRVVSDFWSSPPSEPAPHIALAEWADAVVVVPASATSLSRMARGDCADVLSAVVTATRAPVLLVPSMNPGMLEAPPTRRNLDQLAHDGRSVLWPARGVEVAHAPGERARIRGPMPALDALTSLIHAWLIDSGAVPPPSSARYWNAAFTQPEASWPWRARAVEPVLLDAIERAPRGLLWVPGCGTGLVAVEAARLGHQVVATDFAREALRQAEARWPDAGVVWLEDDVLNSRVISRFHTIVDRCVLHTLSPASRETYVAALKERLRPGGQLLLMSHHESADPALQTARLAEAELARLLLPLELRHSVTLRLDTSGTPARVSMFVRPVT